MVQCVNDMADLKSQCINVPVRHRNILHDVISCRSPSYEAIKWVERKRNLVELVQHKFAPIDTSLFV